MQTRRVRIGCTFTYVAEIDTPVVFHVQPRHAPDIALAGGQLGAEPEMALRDYTDLYGNPCTRAILPSGRSRFSYGAVATVPDATEDADEDAPENSARQAAGRHARSTRCPAGSACRTCSATKRGPSSARWRPATAGSRRSATT